MNIRTMSLILICAWAAAYMHYSIKDRKHCNEYGVQFGGESLMLDGYCLYGDIRIPVEWYRGK